MKSQSFYLFESQQLRLKIRLTEILVGKGILNCCNRKEEVSLFRLYFNTLLIEILVGTLRKLVRIGKSTQGFALHRGYGENEEPYRIGVLPANQMCRLYFSASLNPFTLRCRFGLARDAVVDCYETPSKVTADSNDAFEVPSRYVVDNADLLV